MVAVYLTKSGGAFLGPLANIFGMILEFIYTMLASIGIHNVGVCIILLTFVVNGLMIPLTIKQQKFSRLSAKMSPELSKIQAKYKGKKDPETMQKMNAEQQAIYQKYGASPAGGCLPLLITMPILLALYRVINNIPAYVPAINDIYMSAVDAIRGVDGFEDVLVQFVKGVKGAMAGAVNVVSLSDDVKNVDKVKEMLADNSNYIIDILSQFKEANWEALKSNFSGLTAQLNEAQRDLKTANSFLGLNIMDNPNLKSLSVSVPVLAVVTQFVQTKLSMAGMNTKKDGDDSSMASSMNAMNNVMPFVSGIFCLAVPIGVGIYWVAGNLFRILQALFINKYLANVDVEALVEKNSEKNKKKMEKRSNMEKSMQEYAKRKTGNINVDKGVKSDVESGGERQKGSISDYANMLSDGKNRKGGK